MTGREIFEREAGGKPQSQQGESRNDDGWRGNFSTLMQM